MEFGRSSTRSLRDDDDSSRSSYNQAITSDSECSVPGISVRDMVKRYNSAAKRNQKPNNGIFSKLTQNNGRRQRIGLTPTPFISLSNSGIIEQEETKACCRNCESCLGCRKRWALPNKDEMYDHKLSQGGNDYDKSMITPEERSNKYLNTNQIQSSEHSDLDNYPSSFKSKTTIAKTSSGVRITIDIFFDEPWVNVQDVIGNHLETDIPSSRILNDFQQHILETNKQS